MTFFEASQNLLLWQQDMCLCPKVRQREGPAGSPGESRNCVAQGSDLKPCPSLILGSMESCLGLLEDFHF